MLTKQNSGDFKLQELYDDPDELSAGSINSTDECFNT
jgi:hypothetical protein